MPSWPAGHAYFNEVICFVSDMSAVLAYINLAPMVTSGQAGLISAHLISCPCRCLGFFFPECIALHLAVLNFMVFICSVFKFMASSLCVCLLSCQKLLIYYPRGYKKITGKFLLWFILLGEISLAINYRGNHGRLIAWAMVGFWESSALVSRSENSETTEKLVLCFLFILLCRAKSEWNGARAFLNFFLLWCSALYLFCLPNIVFHL